MSSKDEAPRSPSLVRLQWGLRTLQRDFTVVFAEGTDPGGGVQKTHYRVVIEYREPDYEARFGRTAVPYRWTYSVTAADEERARASAISQFRETERLSWAEWRREIVAISVNEDELEDTIDVEP
jgi:hypothetical protein